MWTPTQRTVLAAMVLGLGAVLLVRVARNRQEISDPQPAVSARADQLQDQLDPNVATWQELAVLPQLGEKRAKDIITYREQYRRDRRGDVPFRKAEDLLVIKGIGVATIETLRPYLSFPSTQPTTRDL